MDSVAESSVQVKERNDYWKSTVFRLASTYDSIVPEWWSPSRDSFFRGYWYQENFLASAIYAIANRNAAFGWQVTGVGEDIEYAQQLLQFAEFGEGWQSLINKFTIDYETQDNGAFLEVIRPAKVKVDEKKLPAIKEYYESNNAEWFAFDGNKRISLRDKSYTIYDSPLDLPIGIAHLDAGECQRTGDPDTPVIYRDRNGKKHALKWWQVLMFNEMPSPIQKMNGVGYSALTRVFRASHIMQSISLYYDEKVSGRFNKAIFLTNVDPDVINDAVTMANQQADNRGLIRYSSPIVAATFKPDAAVSLDTINLAEIPDGFDQNTMQNWYIANLALALGVDYGFLAPLPGKGLGTASQSETMQRQAKGKSSRLFMDSVSNALNFKGVLPKSVQFEFVEKDPDEEERVEKSKKQRADRFNVYIENDIVTPTIAQQMLSDIGDIPKVYLEQMGQEDTTSVQTVEGDQDSEALDAQHEGDSEVEKIKARKAALFKKRTLFERFKNVARKAFGKKQVETPEVNNEILQTALDDYGFELEQLVVDAQNNEISQEDFEERLSDLILVTLPAIYSEMSGLEPEEFTEQDEANLEEYIAVNLDSVEKISNDIYEGRYEPTEEEPDRPLILVGRLGLWVSIAAGLAFWAMLNNPELQDEKYQWNLGISEHCDTCLALDGQVHTAREWRQSGFYPRNTDLLLCNGFNCACSLNEVDSSTPSQGNLENVPTKSGKHFGKKRWVTIDGNHVLIGGGGGGGGGGGDRGTGSRTFRSDESIDE